MKLNVETEKMLEFGTEKSLDVRGVVVSANLSSILRSVQGVHKEIPPLLVNRGPTTAIYLYYSSPRASICLLTHTSDRCLLLSRHLVADELANAALRRGSRVNNYLSCWNGVDHSPLERYYRD